jgi:hypothetical protein
MLRSEVVPLELSMSTDELSFRFDEASVEPPSTA